MITIFTMGKVEGGDNAIDMKFYRGLNRTPERKSLNCEVEYKKLKDEQ